jgi:hypothetical protein
MLTNAFEHFQFLSGIFKRAAPYNGRKLRWNFVNGE